MKRFRSKFLPLVLTVLSLLSIAKTVRAGPRIEDVFQSTQDAMSDSNDIDGRKVGAGACVVVGLIVVIALISKSRGKGGRSKSLNHQGKLLKELQRELSLKPTEIRQLKALVDASPVENPLTLMLCPSLLSRAAKEQPAKVDRRALGLLAKRLAA